MSERGRIVAAGIAGVAGEALTWSIAVMAGADLTNQVLLAFLVGGTVGITTGRWLIGVRYFPMRQTRRARLVGYASVPLVLGSLWLMDRTPYLAAFVVLALIPLGFVIDAASIWDQLDAAPTGAREPTTSPDW